MYFQLSPILGRWGVRLGLVGVVIGGAIISLSFANAFGGAALAQVVPDNTLGGENSVVTSADSVDTISGGATRGGNLFHSFQQFSVPTNGAAIFNNATNIQNILTRVTGSSVSNIDGLIQANGAANLFLLNPNGIVFGQNARLNIGGSFIATTASSINFADGTQFSATPGTGAPLLTVSVPLGLQFGTGSGNIINRASGVGLQVQPGKAIGIVGGNINLEGGRLTAEGGRIELGAVAVPGVVGISPDSSGFRFSFPTHLTLGDISLTNSALVDVRAGGGGSIAVNTRNLDLFGGSELVAGIGGNQGSVDAVAGDVDVYAQDTIAIDGVGEFPEGIFSSGIFNNVGSDGTGKAGNINIRTGSLSLSDRAVLNVSNFGQGDAGSIFVQADSSISLLNSNIFSNVSGGAVGNGGAVNISAGSLSLIDGSQIVAAVGDGLDSLSGGRGNGGNINIDVRNFFSADGTNGDGLSSGVFTSVGSGAVGKGGNVDIRASSLYFTNGAFIFASTFGQGNAGDVTINVRDGITFAGFNSYGFSAGIFSTVETGGVGNGGNINLTATSLYLTDGARISASTSGRGNAGNITVDSGDIVSITGVGLNDLRSGVFNNVEQGGRGRGGNINLKSDSLSLADGGIIVASTLGQGDAGNATIDVGNISIDGMRVSGEENFASGVFSVVEATGVGKGGDINIKARSLSLTNGGYISASTFGQGNAGNIALDVSDTISFQGSSSDGFASGVFSYVGQEGRGNGGNINIRARSLSLANSAQVNSSSFGQGNAGNVDVNVRILDLDTGGIFASTESGDGGDIQLRAGKQLTLRNNSQISTTAGLAQQPGNGGNITIDSPLVIANANGNNNIVANAFFGAGGRIELDAQSIIGFTIRSYQELQSLLTIDNPRPSDFFTVLDALPSNDIASISTSPIVSAAEVFGRTLVELPTPTLNLPELVASGCPSGAENRFVVAGRGGLPPAPGDKLSTDALLTDWATLETPETENRAAVETTTPETANTTTTPLVEATTWQFGSKGEIILSNADRNTPNQLNATPSNCPSS